MKDILIKNLEKVLLTTLLIVLAACSVYMILAMDKQQLTILKNDAGVAVKTTPVSQIIIKKVSLEEDKPQPYDSKGYIYCRNIECNYLIHRSLPKCTWCDTETKPPSTIVDIDTQDKDKDGISDTDEVKMGLNPEDSSDALVDLDEDGFSNLDEISKQTDIRDKNDHPSIVNRVRLHSKIRGKNYYPITLSNFGINDESDKKTWDIYADVYIRGRKKSIFKRINDKVEEIGYTIIDVDKDDKGREYIMIQKEGEEPVKILSGRNRTVKNVVYILVNELTEKLKYIELNKIFELEDKSGSKEQYKATKFDVKTKLLHVIDYKTKDTVTVGLETKLQEPGVKKSDSTSFEEELLR